jgi:hypothetical protein
MDLFGTAVQVHGPTVHLTLSMNMLFQELKQLLLIFIYNLKGKINQIENISKPTKKNLCFKHIYEFAYCLRMINMLRKNVIGRPPVLINQLITEYISSNLSFFSSLSLFTF